MNVVLTTLNAKYIHSSLALRSLKSYWLGNSNKPDVSIFMEEFTINHEENFILAEIFKYKPDIIGFACYIWNIEMTLSIINALKKVLPQTIFIVGGPEVSYDYSNMLLNNAIDIVVIGEGEKTFKELIDFYSLAHKAEIREELLCLEDIKGISFVENAEVITTQRNEPLGLCEIPFPYDESISDLAYRILYYEASRGCPFNCQYCLSSIEKGIRFLTLERLTQDLGFFLKHNVRQVKFVDRTFNCSKEYAMDIWKFLIRNDNGTTNFHFEISADLLDEEMFEVLQQARQGLFQFEIGIQSTNSDTLDKIRRKTNLDKIFKNIRKIKSFNSIHQHLDLIAGLPGEKFSSFRKSFDDVYSLRPEQLQLGFLKLLRGSGLRESAHELGILYKDKAPYEVLATAELCYEEMLRLKYIEEMLETFYNSGKFMYTIEYIMAFFQSPFDFYEKMSVFWIEKGYHKVSHNKMKLYTIMHEFFEVFQQESILVIDNFLKFDIFLHDNVKNIPEWGLTGTSSSEKSRIKEFIKQYCIEQNMQTTRKLHVEKFDYDIIGWIANGGDSVSPKSHFILFRYTEEERDANHGVLFTTVKWPEE